MQIVYKKTDEWKHRVKTSDEWYEWQRVVQRQTTTDNEWQRVTINDNEWQRVAILANFPFFFFFEKERNLPLRILKRLFKHWRGSWRETIEVRIELNP